MKSLRLLNIEDSDTDASLLLNYLTNADFTVQPKRVKTADEMKAALIAQDWDIIVSKYQMPDFTGLQAYKILKKSGLDIPFIIISETAGEEAAVKMMVAGINDYLMKDNLTHLIPAVEREIQKAIDRKARRYLEENLRENEKRLKFALSSIGIGTWELNLQTNIIECSAECYEIIKMTDFSGKLEDFKAMLHPEDAEFVWNEIRQSMINRTVYAIEFRIVNSHGEVLWLSKRGITEHDKNGKPIRINGILIDITARKRLEQNLLASDSRFRALFDSTIAGVTLCDESGKLIYVNNAYLKIVGYTREDFEQGKLNWRKLTAPEFEAADQRAIAQVRASGASEEYEKEYIRQDGSRVPVLLGIALTKIDGEENFISAILDITQRKTSERELRESEENFRALTEATTQVVWTMTDDRLNDEFLDWWKNLTGQNEEETQDLKWINAVHPEDRETVAKEWLTAIADKSVFNTVYRVLTVSGEYRFLAVRGVPVFDADGKFRQWIGAMSDITVRKRGEEEVQQSERRFRSLISAASQIVWTANAEGIMQTAHTPNGEPFSLKEETVMQEWISRLHPEDKDRAIEELANAVKEKNKFRSDYRLFHNDNSYHYYISRGTPVVEKNGSICEWVGTLTDVTKSKAAEENLRKSEEQLRQGQKLESVGRLAGGIAHDFNNMLTAINGYSELTLRSLSIDDPLRRNIEEIKKAGERSAELTHQLLAFSRRQMLQPKILDINNIISETAVLLKRLIGEDIKLVTELSSDISRIEADPGQISQVILNLVVNSRDAMPNGGTITIETKNAHLDKKFVSRYEWAKTGNFVLLKVSDTGTGIDSETLQHIFEPFYTTKKTGKGTGLGLATVYGIVKQSGGYIFANSKVGEGTTFEIYLPQIDKKHDLPEETTLTENLPKGNETILLVEDEQTVRRLTSQLLEFCGYAVIEAQDGIEALKICEKSGDKIDLLMTDVVMPQMGGRELAEKLTESFPHIKILFTSGYTDDSIVKHGENESNTNFIQKPFTIETLALKVRKVLDEKD